MSDNNESVETSSTDVQKEKREPVKFDKETSVWKDPILETDDYLAYEDQFPVTQGHVLFVPKDDTFATLASAFIAAYASGMNSVQAEGNEKAFTGFNLGMNVGSTAGQTVNWPHIHLIPRKEGDTEDPTGGVRNVIPGKGNYKENK